MKAAGVILITLPSECRLVFIKWVPALFARYALQRERSPFLTDCPRFTLAQHDCLNITSKYSILSVRRLTRRIWRDRWSSQMLREKIV